MKEVVALVVLAATWYATLGAARPEDLSKQYSATLDYSSRARGLPWTSGEEDVWRLTKLTFALGKEFRLETGPAQVVFGCHQSNVVWAAVFPEEPGKLTAAIAKASPVENSVATNVLPPSKIEGFRSCRWTVAYPMVTTRPSPAPAASAITFCNS